MLWVRYPRSILKGVWWETISGSLVSSVEAHEKMATDSAEAYESTDTELAKELTQQSSPAHGSPTAAPPMRAAS